MGRLVRTGVERTKRIYREKLSVGLEYVAIRAKEIAEDELSTDYPPSSQPGEYPAKRTGQLVDSLTHGFDPDALESYFGVSSEAPQYAPNTHAGGTHWVWLMAAGRLGIEDVVLNNSEELVEAFDIGAETVGV